VLLGRAVLPAMQAQRYGRTVAPGFVPVERHADVPDDVRKAYLASVPAGRMGTPGDIAHAVSFLASEGAGFITGQRIVVDGGRSLGS
jgi:3-oxoacyl-[acyl-carrier protein] reductase